MEPNLPQLWQSNFGMVSIMGISVLLFIIGFIWFLSTREVNKNLKVGEVINKYFVNERVFITIAFVILVNLAEALTAASIQNVHEAPFNQVARFLSHLGIAIMGITCSVYTPMMISEAFDKSKTNPVKWALLVAIVTGSVIFPAINVILISAALKCTPIVNAFLRTWSSVAWGLLPSIMQVTIGLTIAHMYALFLDGLFIAAGHSKLEAAKEPKKGEELQKDISEKGEKAKYTDGVKFLLMRFGYTGQELTNKITMANKIINNMNATDQAALAKNMYDMTTSIKQFDSVSASMDAKEKADKKGIQKTEIANLFAASVKGGKGFGMTLKQLKGN